MTETALLVLGGLGLALLLVLRLGRRQQTAPTDRAQAIQPPVPEGLILQAQPVLTETEASFYNLLRLAVQDQYLVFAQVPLWCLVDIGGSDRATRTAFLNRIALKRVDFLLLHPGTLTVAKVVELDDQTRTTPQKRERDRLVEGILQKAGLELVRLDARMAYTVPALAELLGTAEEG
ncbi:MAG: DUF2726 domain-containing protein [Nitrospirota bacterium]